MTPQKAYKLTKRIEEIRKQFYDGTASDRVVREAITLYFNMPTGPGKLYIWCRLTYSPDPKVFSVDPKNMTKFASQIAHDLVDAISGDHDRTNIPDHFFHRLGDSSITNDHKFNLGRMAQTLLDVG